MKTEELHHSKNMHKHARQSSPICSVCGAYNIEIWILICSLAHWHLIHTFVSWYNLASAWHTDTLWRFQSQVNCDKLFSRTWQFPCFWENHRGDLIIWAGGDDTVDISMAFFSLRSPSGYIGELCEDLNHPNCDNDQLHSLLQTTIMIQQHKCYIRLSSACKWWPFKQQRNEHWGRC